MKTINKTQATTLKKIIKTLSDIEEALLNFQNVCVKKRLTLSTTVFERIDLEDCISEVNSAVSNLHNVKTHIDAICDIAEISRS